MSLPGTAGSGPAGSRHAFSSLQSRPLAPSRITTLRGDQASGCWETDVKLMTAGKTSRTWRASRATPSRRRAPTVTTPRPRIRRQLRLHWVHGAVFAMLAQAIRFRGAQHIAMPILVQVSGAQQQIKKAIGQLLMVVRQMIPASPFSIPVWAMLVMEKLTNMMKMAIHMKMVVVALQFEVTEPTNGTCASLTPPGRGMR